VEKSLCFIVNRKDEVVEFQLLRNQLRNTERAQHSAGMKTLLQYIAISFEESVLSFKNLYPVLLSDILTIKFIHVQYANIAFFY
jgi:hypothetical protein